MTPGRFVPTCPTGRDHLAALALPLEQLHDSCDRIDRWGAIVCDRLVSGQRLIAAGNGGSAAQAQHLTSELVGRYRDDRPPLSAIPLCVEGSAVTAIANDYGVEELFSRQLRAHARPGDIYVGLSTSGRSPNVLAAAEAAREIGCLTLSLTGRGPNPLADLSDDALIVDAPHTATVQEIHLIAVHLLCAAVDAQLGARDQAGLHLVAADGRSA